MKIGRSAKIGNSTKTGRSTKTENSTKTDRAKIEKKSFHASIVADITPQKALESISRVSEWWASDFEGHSQKPGDIFTIHFAETFVTFTITEAVAGKKVVWKVTDCHLHWLADKKEWKDTVIDWEVTSKGHATQIDFTHIGLVPEVECYNDCVKGWSFFVNESLFKLITEGKGLPDVSKSSRN